MARTHPALRLSSGRSSRRRLAGLLLAAAFVAVPHFVSADSIVTDGLAAEGKVTDYKDGQIIYQNSRGDITSKDVVRDGKMRPNIQVLVTAEPALTAAETSLAAKKYDEAIDGYLKVLNSSTPWVRTFASDRLLSLSDKSNRPDAVVAAWVSAVQRDPAAAEKSQPAVPPAGSTYLATVATRVQAAVSSAKSDAVKGRLLDYLLKVHIAQGDQAAVNRDKAELTRMAQAGAGGEQGASALVTITLMDSQQDLAKKNYKAALDRIEQNRANFLAAPQQADALWILASAKDGLSADSKDAATQQGIAMDYMRLVANFPTSDNVADALYHAGGALEKAGDKEGAVALYRQAVQYKDRPAAAESQKALLRLGAK